jgi:hypothetical protein
MCEWAGGGVCVRCVSWMAQARKVQDGGGMVSAAASRDPWIGRRGL